MRLWTLHPQYLDPQGLVALWRESLLARAVLRGETRGYKHHPQLERFRMQADPLAAVDAYLAAVHAEACVRGYRFDAGKFDNSAVAVPIDATSGQLAHEWEHLLHKLETRNPALFVRWREVVAPACHPLFRIGEGPVAAWERHRTR